MLIVMLWRDHAGRGHGHASLSVTRPRADGAGNESVAVITWFGQMADVSSIKSLSTAPHSVPVNVEQEWKAFMGRGQVREAFIQGVPKGHGLTTEFKPPSNVCHISSLSDPDTLVGLSDANILLWWEKYKQKPGYNVLTRNCSTAVAGALIAGGGLAFASPPGFLSSVWTPSIWSPEKVYEWATKIISVIEPANSKYRAARATIEAHIKDANEIELWDVETWKTRSSKAMAHRYQLLKDIDTLLGEYHVLHEQTVREHGAMPSDIELPKLGKILDKIRQQMTERPNSDRREAILHLGGQVVNRIRVIKEEANRVQREIQLQLQLEAERKAAERQRAIAAQGYDKQLAEINAEIDSMKAEHQRARLRLMTQFRPMDAKLKKVLEPSLPPEQIGQAMKVSLQHRMMGQELLMKALGAEEKRAKEIQALIDKIP